MDPVRIGKVGHFVQLVEVVDLLRIIGRVKSQYGMS